MNILTLEEEMSENSKVKQEAINQLKEWHRTQPHLPQVMDGDYALFLHKHYYSDMEMSRITFDKYLTMRTHSPEFFRDRDPLNSQKILQGHNTIAVLPLEKRTRKGHKVILIRLVDTDPTRYNFNSTVAYMNAVMDVCIREEGTYKGMCRGYTYVFDLSGFSIEHLKQLTYMGLKKVVDYYVDAAPIRWIDVHFVDSSRGVDYPKVKKLFRSHVSDLEIYELSYFHNSMEDLNTFIPLVILPNELGGSGGQLMDLHNAQMEKLENNRDWLMMMETKYLVDETLRPRKPNTVEDVFGREKEFTNSAEDMS